MPSANEVEFLENSPQLPTIWVDSDVDLSGHVSLPGSTNPMIVVIFIPEIYQTLVFKALSDSKNVFPFGNLSITPSLLIVIHFPGLDAREVTHRFGHV
jgi:hypothetical protein